MYNSGIDEFPDLDLEEFFNRAFDEYPEDFRQYWGLDVHDSPPAHLDSELWERRQALDRVARRIAELANVLVRPPSLPDRDLELPMLVRTSAAEAQGRLRQIIEDFRTRWPNAHGLISRLWDLQQEEQADYRFLRASLQLYLSSYLLWPRKLAERVIALTQYASRVRAGRARQYLSRVSRCYLYGMVPELAVMARAALHAVLEDCIEEEQVRRIQDAPSIAV